MLSDYLFPESRLSQLRNYAIIAAINIGIAYLQTQDIERSLTLIVPPFHALGWLGHIVNVPMSNVPRFVLVWSLASYQAAFAFWACWWYPGSGRKVPFVTPPDGSATGPVDGLRLQRPWWVTPAFMTIAIIASCYAVVGLWLLVSLGPHTATIGMAFTTGGIWPLFAGLVLAGIGLLAGQKFTSGASAMIGGRFGVEYLPEDHWLTQRVYQLADKLDLPHPQVGLTSAVNAFAMGTDRAAASVVIGRPLVENLQPGELDAVIGHELGHIASHDMLQMQFAAGYQRMFGTLARRAGAAGAGSSRDSSTLALVEALSVLAERTVLFGSELLMMRLSRSREYYADAIGAAVTSPASMIGALEGLGKIKAKPTRVETTYGYLMFWGKPSLARALATHPSLEQRRRALRSGAYLKGLPRKQG